MTFSLKNYKIKALILVTIILYVVISQITSFVIGFLEVYWKDIGIIKAPGTSALILTFFGFYDKKLWNKKWFNKLVTVPDISGRYVGSLRYFHTGGGERKCTLEITQTGSTTLIRGYFQNETGDISLSESSIVDISESGGFYDIIFIYRNDGVLGEQSFSQHIGVNNLRLLISDGNHKVLSGRYFNNRETVEGCGQGLVEVKYETKTLRGTI